MNETKTREVVRVKVTGADEQTQEEAKAGPVAFALGGLGGNNAHGAGFLHAALKKGVEPAMISCTSGQIYWVFRYLLRLQADRKGNPSVPDLRSILQREIESSEPSSSQDINFAEILWKGKPGVCAPAVPEFLAECLHNAAEAAGRIFVDWQRDQKPFLFRGITDVLGAHYLNPQFSNEFFEQIADELQASEIGIAFNSYNPDEGREYVYLNQAARKRIKTKPSDPEHYEPGQESTLSKRRVYQDITARAVRRGLWLYWYGVSGEVDPHLDGAYLRQIMLSELVSARTIYVVRPLHSHWSGDLPTSWTSLEDLKTKMNLNGAYMAERCQIELMNKLLEDDAVKDGKYHHVNVKEIEMDRPRGFFGYAFEDIRVFDEAFEKSMTILPGRRVRRKFSEQVDALANPQERGLGLISGIVDAAYKGTDFGLRRVPQELLKDLV